SSACSRERSTRSPGPAVRRRARAPPTAETAAVGPDRRPPEATAGPSCAGWRSAGRSAPGTTPGSDRPPRRRGTAAPIPDDAPARTSRGIVTSGDGTVTERSPAPGRCPGSRPALPAIPHIAPPRVPPPLHLPPHTIAVPRDGALTCAFARSVAATAAPRQLRAVPEQAGGHARREFPPTSPHPADQARYRSCSVISAVLCPMVGTSGVKWSALGGDGVRIASRGR